MSNAPVVERTPSSSEAEEQRKDMTHKDGNVAYFSQNLRSGDSFDSI